MKYLLVFVLAATQFACAYNYAGKEGKVRTEPKKDQNPQVVTLDKDKDQQPPPAADDSPCGIKQFAVHFYNSTTSMTRTVDCAKRTVVSVDRAPMGESIYNSQKMSGLPEDRWYIEVDPKGLRAAFLNNQQLLKLSREFNIEFHGRDSDRGLLIYIFLEDLG